jgi:WD40 repeat protein
MRKFIQILVISILVLFSLLFLSGDSKAVIYQLGTDKTIDNPTTIGYSPYQYLGSGLSGTATTIKLFLKGQGTGNSIRVLLVTDTGGQWTDTLLINSDTAQEYTFTLPIPEIISSSTFLYRIWIAPTLATPKINVYGSGFDSYINGVCWLSLVPTSTSCFDYNGTKDIYFKIYGVNLSDEMPEIEFNYPQNYTFSSSTEWYYENVTRYGSSTEFFSAFTGLFTPIFETIGTFANIVGDNFNNDDGYNKGYLLGEVIPKARAYIAIIDGFFGGFPIVTLLILIILIMFGIFVIRLVMKFIPFFG